MASPSNEDSPAYQADSAGAPLLAIEDILCTEELKNRPARLPDYQAENEALVELAKHMAKSPDTLLQRLAEAARQLCRAGSAGVSLEEMDKGEPIFRWCAIDGRLKPYLGGTMPRRFSPCGTTVDREQTLIMCDPVRFYPYIAGLEMPIREVLLVPFYSGEKPVGTVWVISHEVIGHFNSEDVRLLTSLSLFAAAAYDSLLAFNSTAETQIQLQEVNFKLEAALQAGAIATWSWDVINDRVQVDNQGEIGRAHV